MLQNGDLACVLFGCKYPLILREWSRATTSLGHHIFRRIHVGQRARELEESLYAV
jgi:hypothetical protein